jgi:hypothetical protein
MNTATTTNNNGLEVHPQQNSASTDDFADNPPVATIQVPSNKRNINDIQMSTAATSSNQVGNAGTNNSPLTSQPLAVATDHPIDNATANPLEHAAAPDVPATYTGNMLGLVGADDADFARAFGTAKSAYQSNHDATSKDTTATIAKCRTLGIDLTTLKPKDLKCPRCTRRYESPRDLKRHYYGGPEGRGCCWWNILEKQRSLIEKVLDQHVKTQTDLLIGVIMNDAKVKVLDTPSFKRRRLLNWHDILKFMESTLQSSHLVNNDETHTKPGAHAVLETLQIKPNASPLVLNPSVMDSARRRLIDRYADVPR